jgi:4-hydroxybenzoate polyprenyltransferase
MRAYLQLVRLPNVFTAMADILLGYLFTHESLEPAEHFALLLAASSLLYMAGMVLNDFFDREQDARERPFRPIPSGKVSPGAAARLGFGMLGLGATLGWVASYLAADVRPGIVATALAAAVVAYDGLVKRTPLGPVTMGACRMLNVLLGMSLAAAPWQAAHWVVAGGIGFYIVGVTVFARSEARHSPRGLLALGVLLIVGGIALVASLPSWVTGSEWPEIRVPPRWYVFWGLLAMLIAWRCIRAVVDPRPQLVQAAVRSCIFSLIVIDAGACLAVQETFWGVVILLLLVPTMTIGRWIYST